MRRGLLPWGKTLEAGAVDQKNVQPAVVVVIVESHAAAGGFQQIFVFVLAAEDGFYVQAGLASNVEKRDAEVVCWSRRGGRGRIRLSRLLLPGNTRRAEN